jgi:hypothetical protein
MRTILLAIAVIVLGSPIQAGDVSQIYSSELRTNISAKLVTIGVLPAHFGYGYSVTIEEAMQPGLGSHIPLPPPSMSCRCFNGSVETKTCPGDRNGFDPSGFCDCRSDAKIVC